MKNKIYMEDLVYLGDFTKIYENDDWVDIHQDIDDIDSNEESILENNYPLNEIHLEFANFQNADLSSSIIISSYLMFSNFIGASLFYSEIFSSDFHGSDFQDADMEYSEIKNSNFSSSNFYNANLKGVSFLNSNVQDADLRGADLLNCKFEKTSLLNCRFNKKTKLPFDQKEAIKKGMIFYAENLKKAS